MPSSLNSHYTFLIGLESHWKVAKANHEMEQHRVVIDVSRGPVKVACPDCGKLSAQRDLAPARSWRHLDTMNFGTIIQASVPRCNCPDCGVKTVAIPWAGKHSRFTLIFEAFAIEVLRMAVSLKDGRLFLGLSPGTVPTPSWNEQCSEDWPNATLLKLSISASMKFHFTPTSAS
jgi:predicted RNA-binding Zn-ribbon protein involved in translation (DUF1610 family)